MLQEVRLSPGWLERDGKRAAARRESWSIVSYHGNASTSESSDAQSRAQGEMHISNQTGKTKVIRE